MHTRERSCERHTSNISAWGSVRPREKQLIFRLKCHSVYLAAYQRTERARARETTSNLSNNINSTWQWQQSQPQTSPAAPAAAAPSRIFSILFYFFICDPSCSHFIVTWRGDTPASTIPPRSYVSKSGTNERKHHCRKLLFPISVLFYGHKQKQ